jgi:hypothetical protein
MNAEVLYEHLKDVLYFLGIKFHGKDSVDCWIDGNKLVFSNGIKTAQIELPTASPKPY